MGAAIAPLPLRSWPRQRRICHKAEHTATGTNLRLLITNCNGLGLRGLRFLQPSRGVRESHRGVQKRLSRRPLELSPLSGQLLPPVPGTPNERTRRKNLEPSVFGPPWLRQFV